MATRGWLWKILGDKWLIEKSSTSLKQVIIFFEQPLYGVYS